MGVKYEESLLPSHIGMRPKKGKSKYTATSKCCGRASEDPKAQRVRLVGHGIFSTGIRFERKGSL